MKRRASWQNLLAMMIITCTITMPMLGCIHHRRPKPVSIQPKEWNELCDPEAWEYAAASADSCDYRIQQKGE